LSNNTKDFGVTYSRHLQGLPGTFKPRREATDKGKLILPIIRWL
jgi:hypothetical protein